MMIKKIEISNFKSFKKLSLDLGNFNVLIGANASGKSNFTQIFKFLKDIALYGLENAISLQGGVEYFRNCLMNDSKEFSINVTFVNPNKSCLPAKDGTIWFDEMHYEFRLDLLKKKAEVTHDLLTINVVLRQEIEGEILGSGNLQISNVNDKADLKINLPAEIQNLINKVLSPVSEIDIPPHSLLLEMPFFMPIPLYEKIFNEVMIYDFDPKLPKKAVPITGKIELEEDGSNLAFVLERIIEDDEDKRILENLLKDLLPFIDTLDVEKNTDNSLLFTLKEKYFKNFNTRASLNIPAPLISNGTINLTALIVALYFEEQPLAIFEEPERNIHPFLISKVVNMFKDASRNKQIIITTHNPEIVKHAGLENLLLISRDPDGFSNIQRPSEIQEVKTFLKNDIGIEELYIQNLLGE